LGQKAQVMRIIRLPVVFLAAAAGAWGAAANYTLEVSTTYEVAAATSGFAQAMGVPTTSRVDTTATFELAALDGGAWRLTFVTASQQTLTETAVIPDVEKVGSILPGKWLEFAPRTMAAGGIKRAPGFTKDSEEISYNLVVLMFFYPGGPRGDVWGDGARAGVARSYGVNVVSFEHAEGQPLAAFEGEEAAARDFSVVFEQELSQKTNISQMTGSASLEGVGAAVPAPDGLPAYARLDLAGTRDRAFVIGAKPHNLGESVSLSLRLVREGYKMPPEWAIAEEVTAE